MSYRMRWANNDFVHAAHLGVKFGNMLKTKVLCTHGGDAVNVDFSGPK